MGNSGWKTLSSKYVYEDSWMRIRYDDIQRPNGERGTYSVMERRHFVEIIPKIDNKFLVVEQFRYPVKRRSLEFPAGGIESSESPEETARRELQEETGFRPGRLQRLGFIQVAPGHNTGGFHVYLAEDCREVAIEREASEIDMTSRLATVDEMKHLISEGLVIDGPTIAAFCLYLLHTNH